MFEDSQGALRLSEDGVRHAMHVAIPTNFIKDQVESDIIDLQYCKTALMRADCFTKPLSMSAYRKQRDAVGVLGPEGAVECSRQKKEHWNMDISHICRLFN